MGNTSIMSNDTRTSVWDLQDDVRKWRDHFQKWCDSCHCTGRMHKRLAFFKRIDKEFTEEMGPIEDRPVEVKTMLVTPPNRPKIEDCDEDS
jgi:hypothetical protein